MTQLLEWEAYDRLDPIGDMRGDYRMAYLSTVITNIARRLHARPGTEMAAVMDFMPRWDKDPKAAPEKQSVEEMVDILKRIATRQGTRKVIPKRRVRQKPITNKGRR